MTVEELIIALDDARDDATVLAGTHLDYAFDIVEIEVDGNGNIILLVEDDGIATNLEGEE